MRHHPAVLGRGAGGEARGGRGAGADQQDLHRDQPQHPGQPPVQDGAVRRQPGAAGRGEDAELPGGEGEV